MKIKKIILFVVTILIFIGCSSEKSKTIELRAGDYVLDKRCGPPPRDILNGSFNFSFYEILNTDSISLLPIKILDEDSLKSRIKYPEIAVRAGVDGIVLIELKFNDNDEIVDMKPLSNIGASLEESVMNSIKDYKFIFDKKVSENNFSILLIVNFYIANSHRYPFVRQ